MEQIPRYFQNVSRIEVLKDECIKSNDEHDNKLVVRPTIGVPLRICVEQLFNVKNGRTISSRRTLEKLDLRNDKNKQDESNSHSGPSNSTDERATAAVEGYQCAICGKRFAKTEYLRVHSYIHTDAFKCSMCGHCFSRKYHLERHRCMHTMNIDLNDDIRSESKRKTSELNPILLNLKTFDCTPCGKKFLDNSSLQLHCRTMHDQERPFGCGKCKSFFKRKDHLMKHVIGHLNKTFICKLCKRPFNRPEYLTKHLRKIHGLGAKMMTDRRKTL